MTSKQVWTITLSTKATACNSALDKQCGHCNVMWHADAASKPPAAAFATTTGQWPADTGQGLKQTMHASRPEQHHAAHPPEHVTPASRFQSSQLNTQHPTQSSKVQHASAAVFKRPTALILCTMLLQRLNVRHTVHTTKRQRSLPCCTSLCCTSSKTHALPIHHASSTHTCCSQPTRSHASFSVS